MRMTKDGVIKEVPKNLISTYKNLGWREYKEVKIQPKIVEKIEKKD